MVRISVRDLRNKGGRVLRRVARGEAVIVTLDGEPVAELRPIRRAGLAASELVERRRNLPIVDPAALRADLDAILDTGL